MRPTIRTSSTLLIALAMASGCSNSSDSSSAASTAAGSAAGSGATVVHTVMTQARANHTATRAAQGVVVAGGEVGNTVLDSVEIYQNGLWATGGKLASPRKGHTATALPNGQILIAGGQADAQGALIYSSIELYDPATKISTQVGNMARPRSGHVAVMIRAANLDYVFFAGGASNGGSTNSAELYDVINKQVIAIPSPMVSDRVGAEAVRLPSGKILIQGGMAGLMAGSVNPRPAPAELFDINSFTFTRAGTMGIDRYSSALTLTDSGEAVVLGGHSLARAEDTAEAYDANANTWANMGAKLGIARESLAATALSTGEILLSGGNDANAISGAMELYTPRPTAAAGIVTPLAPLQLARRDHTATRLDNGNVLLVGGYGQQGALKSAEEYDPYATVGTQSAITPPTAIVPGTTNPGTTTPGAPPKILAILPNKGKPGDIITIAGQDFAAKRSDNQVLFGGNVYGRVLFDVKIKNLPFLGNVQTLIVEVPAGAQSGSVVVSRSNQVSNPSNFTIDMQSGGTPQVLYTLPRRQEPGKIVTIFGRNFARTSIDNKVSFSGVPAQLIGGITTQSVPFLGSVAVMLVRVPATAVTGDLIVEAYTKQSKPYAFEVTGTTANSNTSTTTTNTNTNTNTSTTTTTTNGQTVYYKEDFEGSSVSLSQQGGLWGVGSPAAVGPNAAASGAWFAGTAPGQGYGANARGYLITPEIDLTSATSASLTMNQFFETDGMDAGRVIVSNDGGTTFYLLTPSSGYGNAPIFNPAQGFAGSSNGWQSVSFDPASFVGSKVIIAFDFASDAVDNRAGWYLDDIAVAGN